MKGLAGHNVTSQIKASTFPLPLPQGTPWAFEFLET